MSLLSYQLQTKRYQKELGIDDRTFNALYVKHSDINLIKQLQLLNPIVSAPPASAPASAPAGDTGFYGTFLIDNETDVGSVLRYMTVTLGYNDIVIDGPHQINGNEGRTFTIPIEDRAPLPSSTIQLKVTFQSSTTEIDLQNTDGFTITDFTDNPLTQENTLSMLIDAEYINNGACAITFVITADL